MTAATPGPPPRDHRDGQVSREWRGWAEANGYDNEYARDLGYDNVAEAFAAGWEAADAAVTPAEPRSLEQLAMVAFGAWIDATSAEHVLLSWSQRPESDRVAFRAAADAVRMMLDMPRAEPQPAPGLLDPLHALAAKWDATAARNQRNGQSLINQGDEYGNEGLAVAEALGACVVDLRAVLADYPDAAPQPAPELAAAVADSRELAEIAAENRELRNTIAVVRNALRDAPTASGARREALELLNAAGFSSGPES